MAGIIQIIVAMNNEQILSICILIVFQVLEMEQSGNPHPLAQFLKTSTNTAREGQFQSFKAKKLFIANQLTRSFKMFHTIKARNKFQQKSVNAYI